MRKKVKHGFNNYVERPELFSDKDFRISTSSPGVRFNCVAAAHNKGIVALRSTYDPKKRTVYFDKAEWKSFITGVKKGEFDFGIK